MGNTHRRQLQSEKKKSQTFSISRPFPARNNFQYVDLDSNRDSSRLGEGTLIKKFRRKRGARLNQVKSDRESMNTENQVHEVDKQHSRGDSVQDDICLREQSNISAVNHSNKNSKQISNFGLFSNLHGSSSEDKDFEDGESSNSTSMKTHGHDSTNIIPTLENQIPSASFSTLWLPFKSPFRRPFFSANNKDDAHSNFNGTIEKNPDKVPMTLALPYDDPGCIGGRKEHGEYFGSQNSQYTPWPHHYKHNHQLIQSKPMSLVCLKQGDIPISTSIDNAFNSDSFNSKSDASSGCENSVRGTVGDCCSAVPDLFQTTIRHESNEAEVSNSVSERANPLEHQSCEERKKSDPVGTKKQGGLIPIRLNRRGRNDTSRGSRLQRNQEHPRVTNKKQRAAHQASSPSASNASLSHLGSLNRPFCQGRDTSPPPSTRVINGHKVTIIDEELKVFIVDLLTLETCNLVRRMTDDHTKRVEKSGSNAVTWRTLYTYTKRDLPCSEVEGLTSRVTDHIMTNIIDIVGVIFDKKEEAAQLHPRSWKEPHLLLYQKFKNQEAHTGVEMHYDGCDITWNCMLSKSTEYDGGGTYVRALRKTIKLEQGQVLVHPGELYHKGCDITQGERALIVCFMDGFDPQIVDPSSAQEDKEIFHKNVRMY